MTAVAKRPVRLSGGEYGKIGRPVFACLALPLLSFVCVVYVVLQDSSSIQSRRTGEKYGTTLVYNPGVHEKNMEPTLRHHVGIENKLAILGFL